MDKEKIIQGNTFGEGDEYVQSANAMFHFMNQSNYLFQAIERKALVPRYCIEDVSYLGINLNGKQTNEVGILQKCFCDMPFHNLTNSFHISIDEEDRKGLTQSDKEEVKCYNTHTSFYGEYAIAFSKKWGENNRLQPVHYLNIQSNFVKSKSEYLEYLFEIEDLDEQHYNNIITELSFIKPLRGKMERRLRTGRVIHCRKNFHDEKEWRYIPDSEVLKEVDLEKIIVYPDILESKIAINSMLEEKQYKRIWLKFNYEDIKYIIVPNINDRLELIKTINSLTNDKFNGRSSVEEQKLILISKILVLNEIRGDW